MLLNGWGHKKSIMFYSLSVPEPHTLNPLKWPVAGLESFVFGLHPLVNMHNCINTLCSLGFCMAYSRLCSERQWISSVSQSLLSPIFFSISCRLFDICADKMENEQYILVMESFFMQNKSQILIQPYLVLHTIQSDTLTNHFCTQWTGWQEVIYKPYNIAAD